MAFSLLRFLAACLGHGAFLVSCQNYAYGLPWSRQLLKLVRKVNHPLILAGPGILWLLFGNPLDFPALDDLAEARGWELPGAFYLGACWVVGFVIAPLLQIRYWLRRRPVEVVDAGTGTVDVAEELGYCPVGNGKHRGAVYWPRNEVFRVDFTERIVHLSRLPPAWEGLSIVHLSDLHFCGTPDREFYQYVVDRCLEWEPDVVALTGDLVDSKRHHRWIIPTLGRLRWRVAAFAILGNHDSWYEPNLTRRRLRRIGMTVLNNTWIKMEVRGEPLVVVGHEGPWFQPAPDLSGCPEGAFRLCLSHTPDNLAWGRRHGIDLMLAGHNHGGQIRFPLIGSVFVPSLHGRFYDCGAFGEPPTLLYVSRGLGGQHPVRYLCRPEVTRIILRGRTT